MVVRADLSRGQQFAQLAHAAGHSSQGDLPHDTHAVVLAAQDEQQLAGLERQLIDHGIPHHAVREPDMGNALTAIGVNPTTDRRAVRRVLGRLPLIK